MFEKLKGAPGAIVMLGCLALLGFMVYVKAEGAVIAAVAAVTTILGYVTKSPEKRDPPSGVVVLAGILSSAAMLSCSAPSSLAADSAFTTEQLRCVDAAKTLDESRQCRQLVRERWGINDAGAR